MAFLLLIAVALVGGVLVAAAYDRLAPPQGAVEEAAQVVDDAVDRAARRERWLRDRLDPAEATGLALTVALAAVAAGGAILGVLTLLVRGNGTLARIDASAAAWGADHAGPVSTRLISLVTNLGDWPALPLIGITVVLLEMRRSPSRYLIPFVLAVTVGDELVTRTAKGLVDRARPALRPVAASLGPSFPSGHASISAAFYAALALILARHRGRHVRALLAGAATALALAVASSRVLLDLHWLSDVVAGVVLGWAWFAVCAIAFGGRLLRFGAAADALDGCRPVTDREQRSPCPSRPTREQRAPSPRPGSSRRSRAPGT